MAYLNSRAYYVSVVANLGGMTLGYDTGIGGGVIALHSFQNAFYPKKALNRGELANVSSSVVSVIFAGALAGSIAAAPMSGYAGRRYALMVSCVIFIIGAMIQIAHTSNIGYIYGGRVISGFGMGVFSNISPLYVAEVAPKEIRGRLTSIFQQQLVIGALIAYFLTYGVSLHWPIEDKQWRLVLGFQAVPAGFMFVGLFWAVESPRWLALKRRDDEAIISLAYYRKKEVYDPTVRAEYAEICAQREEELDSGATLKELLLPGNRFRLFAGLSISVFFVWCGHNSILYYGPTIFQSFGYTSSSAALFATGIFTVLKVCCSPIYIFFCSERYGRRNSLLLGSLAQALPLFILGGLLSKQPVAGAPPLEAGKVMAAMLYIYVIIYSFTWGPINWIYTSEIYPPRLRQIGMATCMSARWISNYAVSEITPIALVNIGWRFWVILACINCASGIFVFFLPETKGVSLEAIDLLFGTVKTATREDNVEKAARQRGYGSGAAVISC